MKLAWRMDISQDGGLVRFRWLNSPSPPRFQKEQKALQGLLESQQDTDTLQHSPLGIISCLLGIVLVHYWIESNLFGGNILKD